MIESEGKALFASRIGRTPLEVDALHHARREALQAKAAALADGSPERAAAEQAIAADASNRARSDSRYTLNARDDRARARRDFRE